MKLGIAVITFDRQSELEKTVEAIKQKLSGDTCLLVADDGSTDLTIEYLKREKIPFVSGANKGVCWNKNRALFHFLHIEKCDVVILLEDDTRPMSYGWESPWVAGAIRHGHLNFAGDWLKEYFVSGGGTVENPMLSSHTSGQCCCYSREALLYAGFFDTRFRGYGFGHVEHSLRLMRLGYGGELDNSSLPPRRLYKMIKSDLEVDFGRTTANPTDVARNETLIWSIIGDVSRRSGALDETEMMQLRDEVMAARVE